jgi:hypothetical protein
MTPIPELADPQKRCTLCGQVKPLDAYHRRRHFSRTGYRAACKDCTQKINQTRPWYNRYSDKQKNAVRDRTRKAIARGDLVPQPCLYCSSLAVEAHHLNYEGENAHLEVEWLCEKHHSLIHGKRTWTQQLELFEQPRTKLSGTP